jgi:TldD protein
MTLNSLFFETTALAKDKAEALTAKALRGMDDGELYLEHTRSESLVFDDGVLKSASTNLEQGFGLRAVKGEMVGYAHSSDISEAAITRAVQTVSAADFGQKGAVAIPAPAPTNRKLYDDVNPLDEVPFPMKVEVLQKIDAYLREKDARVKQVSASLSASWQAIKIIRADGLEVEDIRPLVRLNVSVVVNENGRMESGSSGAGARTGYGEYLDEHRWKQEADVALKRALTNLESIPAPAGILPVVLGSGWCGVLLHEAVGHGLEGDFNRKGTSAFAGLMGKQVAAKGVTVVDNGTMNQRRGSLTVDDEGTPTQKTTLIEDGILVGYIQDRLNARLMGVKPTGNGRRESFAYAPLPRMTNTYMEAGNAAPSDIIASVKRGIYAAYFGGGQVDITSGKFVFSAAEAYMIEDGKITAPLKGATLIGNGPECLKYVRAIGNDMSLDAGIGTCGKAGQSVPVGVGQPSMLIDGITIGGTAG